MAHEVNQGETDVAAQVRSALVERISSERYDLWMAAETNWFWTEQGLCLEFSSDFASQLAKRMLSKEIQSALTSVTGSDAPVEFIVRRDSMNQLMTKANKPRLTAAKLHPAQSVGHDSPSPVVHKFSAVKQATSSSSYAAASSNYEAEMEDSSSSDLWNDIVVGSCNKLVMTTASMIVSEPGKLTPVLIHGPNGSGKTLLVTAIAQRLRTIKRLRRVMHMTSEQFTNDFTEGLRSGGLPMFRRKYRDVDAFILEDVQFLFNKKSTQVELRHTIDNLLRMGKQVVLTSDRALNDLSGLGPELHNRLRSALVTPVFPLDEDVRKELLARMLRKQNVSIAPDILQNLAQRTTGDGRVLSGLSKRLIALATYKSGDLTWDDCWDSVVDLVQATQPIVRLTDIERVVCDMFGLDVESLRSDTKIRSVSEPRMLAMFLARKYTPAAYKEIGQYFGKRRHSTVISAEKTVESWLSQNTSIGSTRGFTARDAIRRAEAQLQVG